MIARVSVAFAIALLLPACLAGGQVTDSQSEYVLGPGDIIDVTVVNHNELDKTLTILPDGRIAFAPVGEMVASGKTPRQLASIIQKELEKTRNNVTVSITVKELRPRKVRIIGAVKAPGSYDVKKGMDRLLDVVAAAGGLSAKPSRTLGRIIRRGAEVIPLDVADAIQRPDSTANATLVVDDLILLDEVEGRNQVHVLGQVVKPGVYDLDVDTSIMSLLSSAGNPTERAALSKAYVLRRGNQIPLNLRMLLVEGQRSDEVMQFKLQNADVLFVPENEVKYAVMGQIAKPGYYPVPERGPIRLLDAINLAGGQAAVGEADLAHVSIIRMVAGKPVSKNVDVTRILKKADLASNEEIKPEDIIYVPARGSHLRGLEVVGLLSPLAYLGLQIFGRR